MTRNCLSEGHTPLGREAIKGSSGLSNISNSRARKFIEHQHFVQTFVHGIAEDVNRRELCMAMVLAFARVGRGGLLRVAVALPV